VRERQASSFVEDTLAALGDGLDSLTDFQFYAVFLLFGFFTYTVSLWRRFIEQGDPRLDSHTSTRTSAHTSTRSLTDLHSHLHSHLP